MTQDEINKLDDESEDARRFERSISEHHDEIPVIVEPKNKISEVLKSIAVLQGIRKSLLDMKERNMQILINRENQKYKERQDGK